LMEALPEAAANSAPWARWSEAMAERGERSNNPAGWSLATAFAKSQAEARELGALALGRATGSDAQSGAQNEAGDARAKARPRL
jgi:hypothetical protein